MRKREYGVVPDVASLLLCGLLAGLVVAAATFPAVAMSGLAVKAGADTFESLPTNIDVLPSPQISYVYASDGKTLLAMMYDENRRDVPIADISKVMQQAIVAAEDIRFYQHNGVDVKGVARAFVNNQNGGDQQGASTLTMQYIREVTSYSAKTPQQVVDATDKTPARKLREMKLAIALEKKLTKQQILERYLNISAYGHGAYGIFAAAHVYFNKDPKDLTLAEASLIAGLVKAPTTNDPATADGLPRAIDRQGYVLKQMVTMGYITDAQRVEAVGTKLKISGQRTPEGCSGIQRPDLGAGFMCDYVRRWWLDQKAFGVDQYERDNKLRSGGYTIISSMNVQTQAAAFKYAQNQPGVGNSADVKLGSSEAVMLAAIEPGTGRVQALATNRIFSNDQSQNGPNTNPSKRGQKGNYPNTTVPFITGGPDVPGYQAGSSFKIFTAVAALESGLALTHTENVQNPFVSNYPVAASSPAACQGTHYCPRNSDGDPTGVFDMWQGFGLSLNTYFVPLEQEVGAEKVVNVAQRLGIQFRSPGDAVLAKDAHLWGAFTLGVSDTTPLDMANAYATLAADGTYCAPIPVMEIRDDNGNKIDAANPQCKSVVDPDIARAAVDLARCPVGDQSAYNNCPNGGTATATRGQVGRPVAGKTGTTDSGKSATFIAMTKQLAVAGMLTDPDNPLTNKQMSHPAINSAVVYTLKDALTGQPPVNFAAPTHNRAFGNAPAAPRSPGKPTPPNPRNQTPGTGGGGGGGGNGRSRKPCPFPFTC
jgi:membrane peptidoglycan carboxypeptidase